MKKVLRLTLIAFALIGLIIGIAGCSGKTVPSEQSVEAPIVEAELTDSSVEQTATTPDTAPQEVASTVEDQPIDYCLDCHTDQQKLIDTARPEEVILSENEGEG